MKAIKMLVFILILACIYACGSKPYPHSMQIADSLVASNPDSATVLLEQLEEEIASEPESTQMYYRLLSIKAKDKAYITHTSDSLIKTVVNYYKSKKDKKRLPEAYYYAGRVYRDLGDAPQALDYFQKAIEMSERSTDYDLISLMQSQTGMLFLYQDIYNKALDAFKKAHYYAALSKDSTSMVFTLRDIGRAFTGMNKIDSTLYYYKAAELIAREINDIYLIGIINQEVTNIYTQLGDYSKAKDAIQASLCTNKRYIPAYYSVLADLYYETGKTDSAHYYYTKLLSIGNYSHKQGGYEGLARIARQQGKYAEALNYLDKYLIYTDSLQKQKSAEAVQKVNSLYNYQLREKENNYLKETTQEQKVWLIVLAASIIIILTIIFTISIIYQQRKKQRIITEERQQEKLKEIMDENYHNSQQYIAENEKRIKELKEKAENTEYIRNAMEEELQEAETIVLELTNKLIETKQKIRSLSETVLKDSQIYKDFYHVAGMPNSENISQKTKISQNDWKELISIIDQTYNNFTWRLQSLYPKISEQELRISVLLKISIPPKGIAELTAHSKQSISSSRKKLYEITHNQEGKPNMWDDFIQEF